MSEVEQVVPRLTVLSAEQIERVHDYALRILAGTGVRVDSERARALFARRLGPGAIDGRRVRIPADLVAWALGAAAREVEVYRRDGALAFRLPGPTRFGIGVTALYYQDPATDEAVPFTREHMAACVRLGDFLKSFDAVSTVGVVQDVAAEVSDLHAALQMVANTAKPLVVLVSDDQAFPLVLDLLEHLNGSLAERAFVVPYLNPISPLVINEGTADKLWTAIDRGLPVIYSNYGMAGASTPITPAGTLALMTAELLAGLVLGQLIRQGAPMILGSLPAYFDMKGRGSYYTPHSYLVDLACAEMMGFYGLPHCGTSGSGMGWGPDLIAAGHQWTNHLVSCLGRVGLVPFVGDNLGATAYSPAIMVYADEVIGQARALAAGFELDDQSVLLDEIDGVGPGGDFLTTPQTLKLFRSAYYRSPVLPNLILEEWQARGSPRAGQALRDHTVRLLAEAPEPADQGDLVEKGEAWIAERGAW